ncbi:2-iminobutanoate/2-iminopropanoate deaminase [Cupriavidus metallidurans]|jgi:enamine deaminase RidA (YjgF/YER057c/UK114 family)|nr:MULTISPECIES: RidA family protein [Cupriavidus]HBD32370.1 RidA family protein [Cupriavidus sp.]KWW39210.1 putative aminoacrylate peracid reductase RutC [Cupriavidus metallidurans]MDE4920430.1 RidA family protein [Cupriavidus metallidurans]QGS33226.1 RidA family protein [Cupriavidus metallidurans]UBM07764.1 RidA family protein [Cupriavidus metallidurans]
MKQIIDTGLPRSAAPVEWAVLGNGILFTTQIPTGADGNVVEGGMEAQARQTLQNLKQTLDAAGGSLADLTQVIVYVTDRADLAVFNRVYAEMIPAPYPNRAAIVTVGFGRPEMLVEILAYAALG